MTTSIVENWAVVLGQVRTIGPSDEPQGFDIVEIKVDEIHEVEGYPNLVAAYLEDEIEPLLPVLMPIEIIDQFQIVLGTILECRVRRSGVDRIFVHRKYIAVHPSLDDPTPEV